MLRRGYSFKGNWHQVQLLSMAAMAAVLDDAVLQQGEPLELGLS